MSGCPCVVFGAGLPEGSLSALSKALLALCAPGSARVCCGSLLGLALPLGLGQFRVS